jgi:uncharacterized membrane protein YccC
VKRTSWRRLLDDLVEIRPAPNMHRIALRATLGVLAPLLVLWSLDRLDLSVYVTFGAFTAVYGGPWRTPHRWRIHLYHGAVLSAATISGALIALSPARAWLGIPLTAVWASLAAALSDRQRWRPPGPVLPVFAVSTCSAIPTTPARLAEAVVVVLLTAALAVALGVAEVWLHRRSRPHEEPGPPLVPPRPERQRVQLIRCGVVVALAGVVATASGIGHPYWAMAASVVPLTVFTFRGQVVRGVHRAVGTLIGIGFAAVLLLVPLPSLAVLFVIAALLACTEMMVVRHYGLALVFITPLSLMSVHLANPEPIPLLLQERLVETLIGVSIGLAAAIITRDRTPAVAH